MIADDVFVADTSRVIGDVILEEGVSIWYGSTLRGDLNTIKVGKKTNIQDGTVVHGEDDFPVIIGENTTIGHCCLIHGSIIGDNCLIGMGSILTDGVNIPNNCFVNANSFITSKIGAIPEGSFIKGNPAKVIGSISQEQKDNIDITYKYYFEEKDLHLNDLEIVSKK